MAAFAGEEAAERDACALVGDLGLAVGEALLEGAQGPACVGVELFEGGAVEVLRADVAVLDDVAGLLFLGEPAERQALRSADVRAMRVDTARSRLVEERAARRARRALGEERRVVTLDDGRLQLEHGEPIRAASGAALAALEARGVRSCDGRRDFLHRGMELLDPVDDLGRNHGVHCTTIATVLRVSVLELPARWNDLRGGLADVDALLAGRATDLAIVPEMAFTGYVSPRGNFDLRRFAEPLDGPTIDASVALARKHDTHLVVPLVLVEGERFFNTSIVVNGTGIVASYRKRHPWVPEQWATAGHEAPPLFSVAGHTITLGICYDAHFLPHDAHDALVRAELLVFTSAWVDEEDSRAPLLASLARQFGLAVANANWAPGVVVVAGQGGSCILDRHGHALARVAAGDRRADATLFGNASESLPGGAAGGCRVRR